MIAIAEASVRRLAYRLRLTYDRVEDRRDQAANAVWSDPRFAGTGVYPTREDADRLAEERSLDTIRRWTKRAVRRANAVAVSEAEVRRVVDPSDMWTPGIIRIDVSVRVIAREVADLIVPPGHELRVPDDEYIVRVPVILPDPEVVE
jgi:hypothetical protein